MPPLPMPTMNSGEGDVGSLLSSVAPLASSWHGAQTGVASAQQLQTNYSSQNAIQKVGSWLGSVGDTVGHLAATGAKDIGHTVVSAIDAPKNLGVGLYELGKSAVNNDKLNATINNVQEQSKNINNAYQDGKIDQDEYNAQMKNIMSQYNDITTRNQDNMKLITHGQKLAVSGDIGTVGDVFALATAGQSMTVSEAAEGGSSKLVDYLVGKAATDDAVVGSVANKVLQGGQILDGVLSKANQGLDNVVSWNGMFGDKTVADTAIEKETADATANVGESLEPVVKQVTDEAQANTGGVATNVQRMKSAAIGLIIKRPLIYNTAVGQVQDLYQDFSTGKYGDGAKEVGLLGLMTLAGGPVGAALKYGGKAASAVVGSVFAKPQFFDELSGYINTKNGPSDTKALVAAIQKHIAENPETATDDVKALNIMAATNLKASNGSVVGAAQRIIDWYASTPQDITTMSHEEVLDDLLKNGRAVRALQKAGDTGRLTGEAAQVYKEGRYALGRISASDRSGFAKIFKSADEQYALTDQGQRELSDAKPTTTAINGDIVNKETGEVVAPPTDEEIQSYASTFNVNWGQAKSDLINATEQGKVTEPVSDLEKPPSPGKIQARQSALMAYQEKYGTHTGFLNSRTFMNQTNAIITSKDDTGDMMKAFDSIKAQSEVKGVPADVEKDLNDYIMIAPQHLDAPYVHGNDVSAKIAAKSSTLSALNSREDAVGSQYFQKTSAGIPVLRNVGNALTRVGLSPNNADSSVYMVFNNNLRENLADITKDIKVEAPIGENRADAIVSKLENYMKQPKFVAGKAVPNTITDMRQLTNAEIKSVLGVSDADAKKIGGAINSAMLKVPLQLRGLGDRIVDYNYKYNPLATPYARIQSAGKFAWNPFFKAQQVVTSEMFSQAEAGGKLPAIPVWNKVVEMVFPGKTAELNNTVDLMEQYHIFDSSGQLEASESLGAQPTAALSGKMLKSEKLSMAGLVNTMASKAGMSTEDYISKNPNDIVDVIRGFTQYPKNGNFINSPLARTINVAFFPARYNLKVAGMAAKLLAKQNPLVQVAAIQGLFKMNDFLKSNEGLDWIQKNSAAIQIFQWVSPLYSLDYTFDILNQGVPHHMDQIGTYGSLGGLPFGIISQGLEAAGVINLSTPYVEPSTGQVIPSYIPKTALGDASAALQGIIGSIFTYPGATAGLPSKAGLLRSVANQFVLGSNSSSTVDANFNSVTPTNLTAQQDREAKVWSASNPQSSGNAAPNSVLANQYDGPMVPIVPPSVGQSAYDELLNRTAAPPKTSSTKLKKGQYIPYLAPGQTQLGQVS